MRSLASLVLTIAIAVPVGAATPPGPMMANVYRLTEAAAILKVCAESPAHKKLSHEKALELQGLATRLTDLVRNIAKHYGDDDLYPTFEATRAKLSSGASMKSYVEKKYQYCGDPLFRDMEAYVSENEKLLNGYFRNRSQEMRKEKRPA